MALLASLLAACAGDSKNNLGARDGMLLPCPHSPNCVASRAEDRKHQIEPFHFIDAPADAFARLKRLLQVRGDTKLMEEDERYLRVEFRTLLGFVDDGEFLLDPEQRCIHVRSASRTGYSDLGKNRRRLEEIRRQFAGSDQKT
jgi:uncharacterized protein (DUF1499 family)